MEKFFYKGKLMGIRVRSFPEGLVALTDEKQPLQILTLKHKKEKEVWPHFHKPTRRKTEALQECVIVIEGKIKITLYGYDKKKFKEFYLKSGELFMLVDGGHSLKVIENAKIYEIKNGPYIDDREDIK